MFSSLIIILPGATQLLTLSRNGLFTACTQKWKHENGTLLLLLRYCWKWVSKYRLFAAVAEGYVKFQHLLIRCQFLSEMFYLIILWGLSTDNQNFHGEQENGLHLGAFHLGLQHACLLCFHLGSFICCFLMGWGLWCCLDPRMGNLKEAQYRKKSLPHEKIPVNLKKKRNMKKKFTSHGSN